MGLYDYNIHDTTEERSELHDVSADKGKTWTLQWLTPTEVLQHRMNGYVTRLHRRCTDIAIQLYPGKSLLPVRMTIGVPKDRDTEEFIDEYLDSILNKSIRYSCEWKFI